MKLEVKKFRTWRSWVKMNPKKFRIRMHRLNGGFAFSLEEYQYGSNWREFLFQPKLDKPYLITGGNRSIGNIWAWTIIDHTDLWTAPKMKLEIVR
jgi:hypothetical protein